MAFIVLYSPVFISDLKNLIIMGYDTMLFGFDSIDYSSISTLTKFLSPLLLMGMGKAIALDLEYLESGLALLAAGLASGLAFILMPFFELLLGVLRFLGIW